MAVPLKLGVTFKPPCTSLSSVTVKVMLSPSGIVVLLTFTVAVSSLLIVPVPVSLSVTPGGALDTLKLTVNVSSDSTTPSFVVATVKVWVSLAVPVKAIAAVLAV